jgi:hypothetical protein
MHLSSIVLVTLVPIDLLSPSSWLIVEFIVMRRNFLYFMYL